MDGLTELYDWLETQSLVICRKVPVEHGDPDFEFVPLTPDEHKEVDTDWLFYAGREAMKSIVGRISDPV